jgi:hypothetical protein
MRLSRIIGVLTLPVLISSGLFLSPGTVDAKGGRGGKRGSPVDVKGYTKKDGTYVGPHHRSAPDSSKSNNWSTKGNINPYSGKPGTKSEGP